MRVTVQSRSGSYHVDVEPGLLAGLGENPVEAGLTGRVALVTDAHVRPLWGERVHAAVQLRPDRTLTADELRAFARQHLADYKVPREVSFPAEFPRDTAGKLIKRLLRDPYWAERNRKI